MDYIHRDLLLCIQDFIQENGIPPTVRELCEMTGKKSTSTVHAHLLTLERMGYISTRKDSPRSIRVLKSIA